MYIPSDNCNLGFIKRILWHICRSYSFKNSLFKFYNYFSFVRSHLEWCCLIWIYIHQNKILPKNLFKITFLFPLNLISINLPEVLIIILYSFLIFYHIMKVECFYYLNVPIYKLLLGSRSVPRIFFFEGGLNILPFISKWKLCFKFLWKPPDGCW
jgi:hypothetical protein